MAGSPNPLPESGVVGKLTPDETAALKQFWRELFQLIDSAPHHPPGRDENGELSSPALPKAVSAAAADSASARNVPKDDNAKERQRANEEMHNARLAFDQYGSERFVQTFWRFVAMDYADSLCLKFLRARKWNPTAGVAMFAACMKWRIESGVEDIFEKGEEGLQHGEGFLHQMTSGKAYLHGSDRLGRPVFYVHARMHKTSEQSPKALEDFVLFQMESLRCLAHGTVEKVTIVFDLTGFGLANMDWRCLWFIVKCLESYYPESLNVILIHNPPWVFNGIWKIVSPALDPQVRAKVQLTKSSDELHVHIAPSHLAPSLGGRNNWSWRYPSIRSGENAVMQDIDERRRLEAERAAMAEEFQQVTRDWLDAQDSDLLSEQRIRISKRMRAHYFGLDPFIRGRGAYHRLGNIVGNGLVAFHYPGAHELASGEFEVIGMGGSKETIEAELDIAPRAGESVCAASPTHQSDAERMQPPKPGPAPQAHLHHDSNPPPSSDATSRRTSYSNSASPSVVLSENHQALSRRNSRNSLASKSGASISASIPTQKSRSSGKLRKRLTTTGSKIKQFGSMRSLASSSA